ncbi:hypothetical protein DDD63_11080 [Actinobaculum sp. 313]|nr:hypothetical protein DDD63_11080 [Actinobaculum sp. 313]
MAKALIVGAAIVDSLESPTRLLAAQRSYPQELAGRWEFPGGKVQSSENPENALLREIREELGCGIILGPPVAPAATHTPPSTFESPEPDASPVPPQLASPPQPSATMQPTLTPHSTTPANSSTASPPTGEHSRTTETAPTTLHEPTRTTNTTPHHPMPTSCAPFPASRRGFGRHESLPASRTAPSRPALGRYLEAVSCSYGSLQSLQENSLIAARTIYNCGGSPPTTSLRSAG